MPAEAKTHPDCFIITATRHKYQTMNDSHAHKQNKEAMFRRLTRLLEYLEWQEFPQNAE